MRSVHVALLLALAAALPAAAATINSTAAGGPWSAPSTWIGGTAPAAADDVILHGPVSVTGVHACTSLTVETTGALAGGLAPGLRVDVAGDVHNGGSVAAGPVGLTVRWGGSLHNAGAWSPTTAEFDGNADATISHAAGASLQSALKRLPGAAGRLTATTPLTVVGNIAMGDTPLVLDDACPLTIDQGQLSGAVEARGNRIRFVSWSYLADCTIDDAVLEGEVEAAFLVRFTTRVTVDGVLQNATVTGGGAAVIQGDLINLGEIRNNSSYGFSVQVSGDVHTEGDISCSQLSLTGVGVVHELSMAPDAVIAANVFLPEFQPATLRATTPVRFADGVGVGIDGRLELAPGASVEFTGFGGMGQGILAAGGNDVTASGNAALSSLVLEAARLTGTVPVHGAIDARDGLEVAGTLTSWPWAAADVQVTGLLRNTGLIQDGAHPVRVTALGDVQNLGAMTQASLALAGTEEQRLAVGGGVDAAAVTLVSHLPGAGHQWFRDGAPLSGATGPELTLAGAGPADLGTYHCEAGGEVSRSIIVLETLDTTGVPAPGGATLAQNRPNPFNPATEIAFSLERGGPVRLTVHDLKGRQLAVLADGELAAGPHAVTWRPRELPSGTYFYRLRTDAGVLARRALLVK